MCLWDVMGCEFLDGVFGGVWMVNVGYGCEIIVDVICDQLVKLNYYVGVVGIVLGVKFV